MQERNEPDSFLHPKETGTKIMLNEEKIKVMNKLAIYEKKDGKKYLPVSRYYRTDYIGLALIKNFFLVTIGYILIVISVGIYFGDFLMENIHKMDLIRMGTYLGIGYLIALVFYSILTYIEYTVRYHKAKKSVREYYQELTKLEKMYNREERRAGELSGGRRNDG